MRTPALVSALTDTAPKRLRSTSAPAASSSSTSIDCDGMLDSVRQRRAVQRCCSGERRGRGGRAAARAASQSFEWCVMAHLGLEQVRSPSQKFASSDPALKAGSNAAHHLRARARDGGSAAHRSSPSVPTGGWEPSTGPGHRRTRAGGGGARARGAHTTHHPALPRTPSCDGGPAATWPNDQDCCPRAIRTARVRVSDTMMSA